VDVLAVQFHFEHGIGEAPSLAGVTGQRDIRHELHADRDPPLTFAGLATPTAGIEAEYRRLVSAVPRQRQGRKAGTHIIPGLDIGGRVAAAALPNGVLVDEFHSLDAAHIAREAIAHARPVATEIEVAHQQRV